jgi:hypothetical protein
MMWITPLSAATSAVETVALLILTPLAASIFTSEPSTVLKDQHDILLLEIMFEQALA